MRTSTVLRGAAGGMMATGAMSLVMLAARRLGAVGQFAPERITEAGLDAADVDRDERTENAASAGAHFAYGAGNGVVFALVGDRLPGPPVVRGLTFAVMLLLISYEGWVPAARILPPLRAHTRGGRWTLIASHIAYGTTLGLINPPTTAPRS